MTKTTQEVNPTASEYRGALDELRSQEARIDALRERQAELEARGWSANAAIEAARSELDRTLDAAMLSGRDESEAAIDAARSALSIAKADAADLEDQLASVRRVLDQAREKISPLLEQARTKHRAYWRAVHSAALEALEPLRAVLARADRAKRAAEPGSGGSVEDQIRNVINDLNFGNHAVDAVTMPGDLPESAPLSIHVRGR